MLKQKPNSDDQQRAARDVRIWSNCCRSVYTTQYTLHTNAVCVLVCVCRMHALLSWYVTFPLSFIVYIYIVRDSYCFYSAGFFLRCAQQKEKKTDSLCVWFLSNFSAPFRPKTTPKKWISLCLHIQIEEKTLPIRGKESAINLVCVLVILSIHKRNSEGCFFLKKYI